MTKYSKYFKLKVVYTYLNSPNDGYKKTAKKFNIDSSVVRQWVYLYNFSTSKNFNSKYDRKKYTDEFKYKVVTNILDRKITYIQAVEEFNIGSIGTISRWVNEFNR